MKTNNDFHTYLAIDSDILRALTNLDLQLKKDPHFDSRNSSDPILKVRGGYVKYLLTAAQQNKVRLLVVTTVYQESIHSAALCNFIKEYCYFPNINAVNNIQRTNEVERLAILYCSPYTYRGETYPAPMKTQYNAFLKKHVPSNDVYAMAEATVEGAFFVTNNEQDFIFNVKNGDKHNKDRTQGIVSINYQNGYVQRFADNLTTVPKPIAIKTIGPMLKDPESLLASTAQDFSKIKADRIL